MGKGDFTDREKEELRRNRFVQSVTDRCVFYTEEFKKLYVSRYLAGETPCRIFREAGFDVRMLGNKRIERASHRWRMLYQNTKEPEKA